MYNSKPINQHFEKVIITIRDITNISLLANTTHCCLLLLLYMKSYLLNECLSSLQYKRTVATQAVTLKVLLKSLFTSIKRHAVVEHVDVENSIITMCKSPLSRQHKHSISPFHLLISQLKTCVLDGKLISLEKMSVTFLNIHHYKYSCQCVRSFWNL